MSKTTKKEVALSDLIKNASDRMGGCENKMIIADNNGKHGLSIEGNANSIAQALFTIMHTNEETGEVLYRMTKNIVLNILNADTKFAYDLASSIINVLHEREENEKRPLFKIVKGEA